MNEQFYQLSLINNLYDKFLHYLCTFNSPCATFYLNFILFVDSTGCLSFLLWNYILQKHILSKKLL